MQRSIKLCNTEDFAGVTSVCSICQRSGGFGIITGRSGYGKTYSLQCYAETEKVLYIECSECMNTMDLISEIQELLNIPAKPAGSQHYGARRIIDYLRAHEGYLLIIDEADKLATKFTQKKLEVLRYIQDRSGAGLVLAGEPVLKGLIQRYITRTENRIDCIYELNGLKDYEVIDYLSGYSFTEEAEKEMIKRATGAKTGCFRLLARTMNNIIKVAPEAKVIDIETVREASDMMML